MLLGDMMQSEDPLQAEIEPVPEDMQALADHLKKQNPPSDVTSYAYRLALLGQVVANLLINQMSTILLFSGSCSQGWNNHKED